MGRALSSGDIRDPFRSGRRSARQRFAAIDRRSDPQHRERWRVMADGSARITLNWAGDERTFRLDWKGIQELEEVCDLGLEEIYARLRAGFLKTKVYREVLRVGLLRGGMDAKEVA